MEEAISARAVEVAHQRAERSSLEALSWPELVVLEQK